MKKVYKLLSALSLLLLVFSCQPDDNTPAPSTPLPPSDLKDTTMANLSYGTHERHKVDVYLPEGRNAETKIIIMIHGGGWIGGNKEDFNFVIDKLQAEWPEAAIVNINYRLANGTTIIHEQMSDDLESVVQFIAAQAGSWNVSQDMAMVGASAGAHLAMLYAYKFNEDGYVKAVGDIFGPAYFADWELYSSYNIFFGGEVKELYKTYTGSYWDEELYQGLSPYHLVTTANYRPTIIFHGTADPIVPLYHSQWFKAKLSDLGLPHAYHEYVGEAHGFNDANLNDCVEKTVAFFKEHM